jgi:NAD+ kinase
MKSPQNKIRVIPKNPRNPINKILVVYKHSAYEKHVLFNRAPVHRRGLAIRDLSNSHNENERAFKTVTNTLRKYGVPFKSVNRHKIEHIESYDLVVSLGGDGTLLMTSHQVKDQLILGVNSSPRYSVGATCSIHWAQFPSKIESILKGQFKVKPLNRLEIRVNGKCLPYLSLNEVLFANRSPAATSRYVIQAKGKEEDQKSSGVWIATATGSTAVIYAAGGKKMPPLSRSLQYLVREPYNQTSKPYKIRNGIIAPPKEIRIINKMMKAALFVDGFHVVHPLAYADQISIKSSSRDLHVII